VAEKKLSLNSQASVLSSLRRCDMSLPVYLFFFLFQDKLAIHLFKESPNSPKVLSKKVGKTPVSILKSRKHFKRNSLTPPIIKKERKDEGGN